MILYIDKLELFDKGGYTKNLLKIAYNLNKFNISKEKLLSGVTEKTIVPTTIFHAGKYVVIYQFDRDFTKGNMAFINFEIDLDENFNIFADSLTPKTVAGFHQMREIIKSKGFNYWQLVELSDNPAFFEIQSQN